MRNLWVSRACGSFLDKHKACPYVPPEPRTCGSLTRDQPALKMLLLAGITPQALIRDAIGIPWTPPSTLAGPVAWYFLTVTG